MSSTNAVQIDDSEWSGTISATDERNAPMNSFTDVYENKDAEGCFQFCRRFFMSTMLN